MNDETVLLTERRGSVFLATLNRPHKGNALNRSVIEAIASLAATIMDQAAGDSPIRAVVITGAGTKAFCAGADVSELDGITGPNAYAQMRRGQRAFDALGNLPIVVIAAINGFALGGGLELAMACDLRIAASTAKLGQPEITLGNLPGWGGTQRLPRLVGQTRATRMILTGDLIPAQEALAMGLVNEVADDAVEAALALAERIALRSPVAVSGAKRAIRTGLEQGMVLGSHVEAEAVAACCETVEQKQAVRAFLNRKAKR